MRYTRLAEHFEVVRHRALRDSRVERAARNLFDAREYPDYLQTNRVAQGVEDVREIDVLESRVVEIPHTWLSSTFDEPTKSIARGSRGDYRRTIRNVIRLAVERLPAVSLARSVAR